MPNIFSHQWLYQWHLSWRKSEVRMTVVNVHDIGRTIHYWKYLLFSSKTLCHPTYFPKNVDDVDTPNYEYFCLFLCMGLNYSLSIWGRNRIDKFKKLWNFIYVYIYLTKVKEMGCLRHYITKNCMFCKSRVVLWKLRSWLVWWAEVVARNTYSTLLGDNINIDLRR